ncbi:Os12g0622800 [Oryza sativa Japonica Group]|uniref:Os12g0622800 protein n=3 Tax=Oryza sativa TaxID=4530 RepID=Q2QLZ8_ORYSJ|nr:hypothetical protein LOC_Os12g42780 [Oryza sativa Japonica Group]EAY83949.1 hypothetical protein OsI_39170 [Oryza sativa Indica Group]EAZ21267.1 hypothetical protein OsJ_36919 [Oryza sativa Japonica Group]BAT18152.1 Os12g0622800 [Oryza sativa Japonica Group]
MASRGGSPRRCPWHRYASGPRGRCGEEDQGGDVVGRHEEVHGDGGVAGCGEEEQGGDAAGHGEEEQGGGVARRREEVHGSAAVTGCGAGAVGAGEGEERPTA